MSKLQLPLMSLVAAIPGAYLTYLLVMVFLNHAEAMPAALTGIAGLTLLLSAFLVVMPIGAMIFGPKGASKKKKKGKGQPEDEDKDDDSAAELSDEFIAEDDGDDEFSSEDEFAVDDDDDFSDGGISAELSDGDLSDGEFGFEDDDYEFDDEDEEDK